MFKYLVVCTQSKSSNVYQLYKSSGSDYIFQGLYLGEEPLHNSIRRKEALELELKLSDITEDYINKCTHVTYTKLGE